MEDSEIIDKFVKKRHPLDLHEMLKLAREDEKTEMIRTHPVYFKKDGNEYLRLDFHKEKIKDAKKSVFDDVDEDIFEPLNKRFSSRMELVMVSKLIGILERGFENIKKKHGVE